MNTPIEKLTKRLSRKKRKVRAIRRLNRYSLFPEMFDVYKVLSESKRKQIIYKEHDTYGIFRSER